jgi:Fe-S cluster assembly ATP-binding protein
MGPNGSGKSTLAQVLAGKEEYEVTEGSVRFDGEDLLEMDPEERAREGVFLAFQYPVEIPGVSNTYFLRAALNAVRKHRGLPELDAMELPQAGAREDEARRDRRIAAPAAGQRGLLGRREEAQRDLPHGGARAAPLRARRDRLGARHRRAAHRRRRRQLAALARPCLPGHHPLPAAAQLHRARLRARADRRPIVRSGGKELALELEEKGYGWLEGKVTAGAAV